jgi:hypothetical protein
MQITLTFKEGSTNVDIAAALRYQANLIDGTKNLATPAEPLTVDEDAKETAAPKAKRGRPAAVKKTAPASFDEDEETPAVEAEAEAEAEESFEDEESFEEETPAPKKAKPAKITIDDVNDACKAFARENGGGKDGREATLKILKKHFKVTSISDLAVEDYPKVLKALAV